MLVVAGLGAPACIPAQTAAEPASTDAPIGTNVSLNAFWQTEWHFLDAMKRAQNGTGALWLTQCAPGIAGCAGFVWDTGEQAALDLDADGWPRSLPAADDGTVQYRFVSTLLFRDTAGHHPTGRYIVLYDGQGTLGYDGDAVRLDAESGPGRDVVEVAIPTNEGFLLSILETDPEGAGDYLRNIRVIVPGGICAGDAFEHHDNAGGCADPAGFQPYEDIHADLLFHPAFLRDLRAYRALRFMLMMRIVESTRRGWEERARLSDATWALERGVPPEIMVELVNRLDADLWVNVPFRADDDHIAQLAALVRAGIRPGLKVYVEYGNEVWNSADPFFINTDWVEARAVARWPDQPESDFDKRMNYHGMRTVEACRIVRNVFGPDDYRRRVRCVLGGFAAIRAWNETGLHCPLFAAEPGGEPCHQVVDALAIAPYFGVPAGDVAFLATYQDWLDQGVAVDRLITELAEGGQLPMIDPDDNFPPAEGMLPEVLSTVTPNFELAASLGIDLMAYEGGQHLVAIQQEMRDAPEIVALFAQVNRDPRMESLYRDYLDGWRARGGHLFMHFDSVSFAGPFGAFGAKEYQQQASAPKYRALIDWSRANPCWWSGCAWGELSRDSFESTPRLR